MAKLSDRIKSLRLSAGMTQEEFGKKFGIVKSTVSLYESGIPFEAITSTLNKINSTKENNHTKTLI